MWVYNVAWQVFSVDPFYMSPSTALSLCTWRLSKDEMNWSSMKSNRSNKKFNSIRIANVCAVSSFHRCASAWTQFHFDDFFATFANERCSNSNTLKLAHTQPADQSIILVSRILCESAFFHFKWSREEKMYKFLLSSCSAVICKF